jgi:hypothetical protein
LFDRIWRFRRRWKNSSRKWIEIEQKKHINYLELKGLEYLLEQIVELIKGKYTKISIDNTVAASYMKKGYGKIEELNSLTKKIWIWCMENGIEIEEVTYLPSKEKLITDQLSRQKIIKIQDWGFNMREFKKLERKLDSFTIDIFASEENKKLDSYRDFLIHKDVLDLKRYLEK